MSDFIKIFLGILGGMVWFTVVVLLCGQVYIPLRSGDAPKELSGWRWLCLGIGICLFAAGMAGFIAFAGR